MGSPAADPPYDHPVRQLAALAATVAGVLVWLACAVSMACAGAPLGIEPPVAERSAGCEESGRDGEDDTAGAASPLSPSRQPHAAAPPAERARAHDHHDRLAPRYALAIDDRWHSCAPPLPALFGVSREGSQSCIAQLLLVSVPTRGPTILG